MINITVKEINSSDWDNFVRCDSRANIFHTPYWADTLRDSYQLNSKVVIIEKNGSVIGGVPICLTSGWFGYRKFVSLPYSDYCIPLVSGDSDLESLSRYIIDYSLREHIEQTELRWEYSRDAGFLPVTKYVRHYILLSESVQNVYKKFSRTQKQNIGIAEKQGVEIRWGSDLEYLKKFYHLQCLTRRRQGLPVQPWGFFKAILKNVLAKEHGFIVLAYKGDQCLAGGLFLAWNKNIMYKYAASEAAGQNYRPNHMIIWRVIEWACANGYQYFDFGRCEMTNEGLRTFKNRWGAVEELLPYSYYGKIPSMKGLAPSSAKKLIAHSPLFFVRMLGNLFYRYFA